MSKLESMKIVLKALVVFIGLILGYELVHLLWLKDSDGWASLAWIEGVPEDGPSTKASSEDVGQFVKVISHEGEPSNPWIDYITLLSLALTIVTAWVIWCSKRKPFRIDRWHKAFACGVLMFIGTTGLALSGVFTESKEVAPEAWEDFSSQLRVGDVIAYRKEKWSARRELFAQGKVTVIGYRLFKYGHLAIVVEDPKNPGKKVLFTSESRKGVNLDEYVDSLKTHNWDAYRLDKWDRIDIDRFREGVLRCTEKSGHFFGYDFTGMFSLWNENLKPEQTRDFGTEYICSTCVVTLLYFGGFESDATPRQGLDLITPYQVVRAKGRFVKTPPLRKEE